MPRRSILLASERDTLLALPDSQDDLIRYYTFNESDLSLIRQRRGDANRLGFAVQLCLLRYPGYALASDSVLAASIKQGTVTASLMLRKLGSYPRQNGLADRKSVV